MATAAKKIEAEELTEFQIPKTFGACADRLFAIRDLQKPLRRKLEVLDEERKAIEQHIIATMPKDDRGGVGKRAKATIVVTQEPSIKDRKALERHILKTKDFSFLQGAPAKAAIREWWDAGRKVPGVEAFAVIKVSVTKV